MLYSDYDWGMLGAGSWVYCWGLAPIIWGCITCIFWVKVVVTVPLTGPHALSLKWTQEPIKNETLKKVQIEQNFFVVSIFTEKKAGAKLKKL